MRMAQQRWLTRDDERGASCAHQGPPAEYVLAASSFVLTATPAQATYAGANGRIAFTANIDPAGRWDLFTMRPDGTGVKRLTILPEPTWPFASPDWSPHSSQLLFISPNPSLGHTQVYRINADGTGLTQLTHSTTKDNDLATWSPDGTEILVARAGTREHAIWVMNADGTGFKKLTSDLYPNEHPEFTPDGRHIIYASQKDGLVSAIWIMNPDGSNKRRLTPAALEAASPDVSPDGSHVVFVKDGDPLKPTAIFSMRIDGAQITRLTHPGCCHHDSLPNYSPDGKQIVFITDRNYPLLYGSDIYAMNADGTNQHQVTTNLTLGGWPDSPFFDVPQPDWGSKPSPT